MNFLTLNGSPVNTNIRRQVVVNAIGAGNISSSKLQGFTDVGALTTDAFEGYNALVTTEQGEFTQPINNWQGTLNNEGIKFVQVTARTNSASEFANLQTCTFIKIYKIVELNESQVSELIFEMAIDTVQTYDTASGYTVLLRGTDTAAVFEPQAEGPIITLRKVRRVTRTNDAIAARCEINFTSAPNYYYSANGNVFQATYVNFYGRENDAYMDIGRRS